MFRLMKMHYASFSTMRIFTMFKLMSNLRYLRKQENKKKKYG